MITTPTLFMLGAGASCPYGYPTGAGLRTKICKEFPTALKDLVNRETRSSGGTSAAAMDAHRTAKDFADAFKDSNTRSIDLYLARNPHLADLGKKAIALSILEAERESKFGEDMDEKLRPQDWYSYIYHRMTNDLSKPESFNRFKENEVTFVTFNYDRSLEFFLYSSLLYSFPLAGSQKIAEQINTIDILHVYGVIHPLPWQGSPNSEYASKQPVNLNMINALSTNIKTVYEASTGATARHDAIEKARQIFFLGFGYGEENLEALGIGEVGPGQRVFGTALGSSAKERSDWKYDLVARFRRDPSRPLPLVTIEPLDCLSLIREYL